MIATALLFSLLNACFRPPVRNTINQVHAFALAKICKNNKNGPQIIACGPFLSDFSHIFVFFGTFYDNNMLISAK